MEVAGPGSGPAGVSAAYSLGLTTQIPAIEQDAVPGRVPSAVAGVRFVSRSIERRIAGLRPVEVALIRCSATAQQSSSSRGPASPQLSSG